MDPLIQIPLHEIAAEALPRDRTALDPVALFELQSSITDTGLRQPIEVWELPEGAHTTDPAHRYGLISGLRRLTAMRALAPLNPDHFGTIPAFLRTPASVTDALTRMVEENDLRADLSPWEKGAILITTVQSGYFPTLDAAVDGLFPSAARTRRHRIRSLARVVDELDSHVATPESLSLRQMLRLAAACRHDFADLLRHVLGEHRRAGLAAQWSALLPVLDEAEASLRDPTPWKPGHPRRLMRLAKGVTVQREMTARGWLLRFTGPEATGMMMESVMDEVERLYGGR